MAPFLCDLFLAGSILFIIYKMFFRRNNFWKNKSIPFIQSSSLYDYFLSQNKPIQDLQIERLKKYGRIYGYYKENKPVLAISEPEVLKKLLVEDFKSFHMRRNRNDLLPSISRFLDNLPFEKWRRVRNIMSPTFSTLKLKKLMDLFRDCAETFVTKCRVSKSECNFIDMNRHFDALIIDVLAIVVFSTKLDSHIHPNNPFAKAGGMLFAQCSMFKLWLFEKTASVLGGWRYHLFGLSKYVNIFDKAGLEMIRKRKKKIEVGNDLLQLMINASRDPNKYGKTEENFMETAENINKEMKMSNNRLNARLTEDDLSAMCMGLVIAGYPSTSATLTFVTYMLALHQDIQEKVYQEITSTYEKNNTKNFPTFDDLQEMKYLDAVISETLRFYPPSPVFDRVASVEYDGLKDSIGMVIPKGMMITVSVYALHRDPQFFPEPNKFDPDRFHESNKDKIIPYSYMPFSVGPRNCIGMKLALMNIKLSLVHMLRTFHIQRCPETKVPLEFFNSQHLMYFVSLLPKDVNVKLALRDDFIPTK